jgi:ATPase subunit of ABC transporter with duplicated ATPase domains
MGEEQAEMVREALDDFKEDYGRPVASLDDIETALEGFEDDDYTTFFDRLFMEVVVNSGDFDSYEQLAIIDDYSFAINTREEEIPISQFLRENQGLVQQNRERVARERAAANQRAAQRQQEMLAQMEKMRQEEALRQQQERERQAERDDLQMLLLTQSVQSLKDIVANLLMSGTTDKEIQKAKYIMDRIRAAGHDVSSLERLLPNQQPAQQERERAAQQPAPMTPFEQSVFRKLDRDLGDRDSLDAGYGDEQFKDILERLFSQNKDLPSLIAAASNIRVEGFPVTYAEFILKDYLADDYKFASREEKANYQELLNKYSQYL